MKFIIRDVLWLTMVVAVGLGWWRERNRSLDFESQAKSARSDAFDWEWRAKDTAHLLKVEGWTADFRTTPTMFWQTKTGIVYGRELPSDERSR